MLLLSAKIAKIAKNTQIIAVSHLAQIAVMSDEEFLIEKQEVAIKEPRKFVVEIVKPN